jgi:hypothetical protein
MEHENEYHDSIISMLELVWGEGFGSGRRRSLKVDHGESGQ